MFLEGNNYAFIDSQNVNLAIRSQGWVLDWRRFRVYLHEKYHVSKAFLFIGFVSSNQKLYGILREAGFILVFKPTLLLADGMIKGNVDAELVLHSMIQFDNYEKAVIVSGDGDFYCLVEYLINQNKLKCLLIPNFYKYSALLRKFVRYADFMDRLRERVGQNKKGH